ncbi:MAG TPA: outer membrane protein assembly factor BamE [Solimonas sp.]|nr:outer membrane protein assembly factor BamE [Solimonas sp.]
MRALILIALTLGLSACQLIYKLPTRQGNVIEQKQLDQLKLDMSREQVRYLLGTPIASSAFRDERWDYVGYYKSPRGKVASRVVSLYFTGDKLSRMDGVKEGEEHAIGKQSTLENPDVKTVLREGRRDATDESRAESEAGRESGVVITPQTQAP